MWRYDRSWMENFLSSWAVLLLAAMSVTSLALRYVRDPISCHYVYPQANEYFTEDCFQQTSVLMRSHEFVEFARQTWARGGRGGGPRGQDFPNPFKLWPKQQTYHHWVPFALGISALLCLLPQIVWRLLSALLWMDSHALVRTLAWEASQQSEMSASHVTLKDSALVVQVGLRGGNWVLSAAALVRKGLCIGVCVLQMTLIALIFQPPLGGGEEGVGEKRDFSSVNVTAPETLGAVPLPVDPFFCTVEFTHHQNSQSMTMQCLLPLNKVFAKAFVFLLYFFFLLLALCLLDLFYWLGRLFLPTVRDITLIRNLSVLGQSESQTLPSSPAQLYEFAQALGADGRLLLALIADHCGPVTSLRFTVQLWQAFTVQASSPRSVCLSSPQSLGPAPLPRNSRGWMEEEEAAEADPGNTADDIPLELVHA